MKITRRRLKRIIKEEVENVATFEVSQKVISSFVGAISSLRNGESFSYSADGSVVNSLSNAAGPSGMVSNLDAKVVMGIGGVVVILILVAMALGYSVKVGGDYEGASGEIIFKAPDQDEKEVV